VRREDNRATKGSTVSTLNTEPLLGIPAAGGGLMRRLNVVTAAGGGLVLALVGWAIARHFMLADDFGPDQVTVITMVCWAVGFMAGIGAFNGPIGWFKDLGVKKCCEFHYNPFHAVRNLRASGDAAPHYCPA
jgi:hypothetical protein